MADKLNYEELEQQVKELEREVVESRQSKEFLQETEERYHILLAESRDGFYVTSRGGKFIDANQALLRLFGYTREEMIGKLNLWELYVSPHERDKFQREIEQKGSVRNYEVKLRKKNGAPINCLLNAAIRRRNDGSIHGYRGIIRDITEHKRAEKVPRAGDTHNPPIVMDKRDPISEHKRKEEEEIQRSYQIQSVLNKLLCVALENISLEEMLQQFIDQITSIPWLALESNGGIFLVGEDPKVLVMSAHRGLAKPLLKMCGQVPFGRCLCGRAALSGEIVFADSMDERHENQYEGIFSHGHYCIPIISRAKKVLGVITLYLREGHRENHREEEFLNAVANTLAGIIERKQLEEKLIKAEKLAAIGETVAGLAHCTKNILFGFEGGVYVVNKALKKDDKAKLNTGLWCEEILIRSLTWCLTSSTTPRNAHLKLKRDPDLSSIPVIIITGITKEVDFKSLFNRSSTGRIPPEAHLTKPLTADDLINAIQELLN